MGNTPLGSPVVGYGIPSRGPDPLPTLKEFKASMGEAIRRERAALEAAREAARATAVATMAAATAPIRNAIAAEAFKYRESKLWDQMGIREPYVMGQNKCNLFVYEMLKAAGARVEMELRKSRNPFDPLQEHPPTAGQWADPSFVIPGFEVLTVPPDSPQPGDVAAIYDSSDDSAHVGIVYGPNETVSASLSEGKVVKNDWGFRDAQKGQVVFRRYVGWPEPPVSAEETSTRVTGVAYETVPPAPEKPRERNKCASPVRGNEK